MKFRGMKREREREREGEGRRALSLSLSYQIHSYGVASHNITLHIANMWYLQCATRSAKDTSVKGSSANGAAVEMQNKF